MAVHIIAMFVIAIDAHHCYARIGCGSWKQNPMETFISIVSVGARRRQMEYWSPSVGNGKSVPTFLASAEDAFSSKRVTVDYEAGCSAPTTVNAFFKINLLTF